MHEVRDALTEYLRTGTSTAAPSAGKTVADDSRAETAGDVVVLDPHAPEAVRRHPARHAARPQRRTRPSAAGAARTVQVGCCPRAIAAAAVVLLGVVTITYLGPDGTLADGDGRRAGGGDGRERRRG